MQGKLDPQSYLLPPQMSSVISATIAQTSQGEVILCHDNSFLYAARVVRGGGNVTFQKFALASVGALMPVIKNYFMAVLEPKRLVVFEVGFNEDGKIMLKFIFNRERPFATTFLREVADNMAELHICFPDNEIVVHQFTVNGKVGVMDYVVGAQNKLTKCERGQLYGSKSMLCANRRCIYYFTNFSNRFVSSFSLAKLENDLASQCGAFPLAYLSKQEEFYLLLSNFTIVNVMNPTLHHRVYCEEKQVEIVQRLADPREADRYRAKDGSGLKVTTYFDMVLIEDPERAITYVFQVKPKGSNLIGVEYGKVNWFWTGNRKLVGLAHDRTSFKIIDEIKLNERTERENPFITALHSHARKDYKSREGNSPEAEKTAFRIIREEEPTHKHTHSAPSKEQAHLQPTQSPQKPDPNALQLPEKYKPVKIIQKNKVSVSKTIHKSKEIEPFSQEEEGNPKKQSLQEVAFPQPQTHNSDPVQVGDEAEQKEDALDEQSMEQECQKMANAILDQKESSRQGKKQDEAENEKEEVQKQQPGKDSQVEEASCEEVDQKKEGDVYPKEESSLSDSLILPDKKQEQDDTDPVPSVPVEDKPQNEESRDGENSLPKSLAVLIGKSNLGGEYGHPLNLFSTSINRNNIFGQIVGRHVQAAADPAQLRRYRSEEEYYNPFTSSSPCLSPSKQKQEPAEEGGAEILPQVKQLFEETTGRLLKAVQELASLKSSEPYLKEKTVEELQKGVRDVLERMMVGEFTSRIERYFYEVFRQTDQVQQQSIKFYKEANNHRASNVETHLNNQEKLVREIRDIESNLRFCISHLKDSSRTTFEALMRDWQQETLQTRKLVDTLAAARVKIEAEEQARVKRYEQTKQNLDAIKILLAERISLEGEKRQRKADRERQKQADRECRAKKEKKRKGEKKAVKK